MVHRIVVAIVRVAKVRSEKALGLQRLKLPPANWFPSPVGNRSRLFLSNEKHGFLGIFLREAERHQCICRGWSVNAFIAS